MSPYFVKIILLLLLILINSAIIFATLVTFYEREFKAGAKLLLFSLVIGGISFLAVFLEYPGKSLLFLFLIFILTYFFYINFKKPIRPRHNQPILPVREVDEHDVIFARMRLKPNTPDWDTYYSNHPEEALQDERTRKLPGLLSKKSFYYNPLTFNSSETNFILIDYLDKAIKQPLSPSNSNIDKNLLTNYIKNWAKYLGVASIGVAEVKDYHFYTVKGRGEDKGKQIQIKHKYAIAFTVEMNIENVIAAPASSIVFESSQQYLSSATIALQLSIFLKNLGYDSRAHIDGNYELICPLVARDAGLGEIGRMGLLITPKLGPRVRIAVVTTNAPLIVDGYMPDPSTIEFCGKCKKCADCCPSNSISYSQMIDETGKYNWKINSNKCYQYWCISGTDCGRCMAVCPFSHPNNLLHNSIRRLIKRSIFVAQLAYMADDALYGRKPKPKTIPTWMRVS